ncbi:IS1182 family transposase, partial [Rhodomicrobium sp. Az07]|uniref:IS1182 family transposase n=1 Tax=Rhodomicrobium sp. Az07 TaxID=2839034 RepID=UPI001BE5A97F
MTSFVRGADRTQGTMFPERLEDYVAEDNPVRVIDFFVDQLDLGQLGFWRVRPKLTGRPAYAPAVLLKIYVYGYLNRVPSSRRLERECQRNVEVMWLTGCLAPDFKTIADFRKDNGPAIRKVCREFIVVCGRAGLLAATTVAIDGSKFKAVNSRDRNFTQTKVAKRLEQIEASIERYLSELETADRQPSTPEIKRTRLKGKIDRLKQEIERMEAIEAQLASAKDTQISLTDPDARSMQGTGKATGTVGYNVQCAVEMDHHLIVAHDVTNAVHDRHQLSSMAGQAKEALGAEAIEA